MSLFYQPGKFGKFVGVKGLVELYHSREYLFYGSGLLIMFEGNTLPLFEKVGANALC